MSSFGPSTSPYTEETFFIGDSEEHIMAFSDEPLDCAGYVTDALFEQPAGLNLVPSGEVTYMNPTDWMQSPPVNQVLLPMDSSLYLTRDDNTMWQCMDTPVPRFDDFGSILGSQTISLSSLSEEPSTPSLDYHLSPLGHEVFHNWLMLDPTGHVPFQVQLNNVLPPATIDSEMDQLLLLENPASLLSGLQQESASSWEFNHVASSIVSSSNVGASRRKRYRTLKPANPQQALHGPGGRIVKQEKKKKKRVKKVECCFCSKKFYDTRDRDEHYHVHKEEAERTGKKLVYFDCEQCGKRYTKRWSLSRHNKKHTC